VRFRDQRRTLIKGHPLPDDLQRKPEDLAPVEAATYRWVAAPKVHPDNLRPAYNRASRRQIGQYATHRRAALHRAKRRAIESGHAWPYRNFIKDGLPA
jgi:hypothetical protein